MVRELRRAGFDPQWRRVDNEADYVARLSPPPDVILADSGVSHPDTRRALQLLEERGLNVPFIVLSGTVDEEAALGMMRLGAADYLFKDRLARLGQAVKHALLANELRRLKGRAEDGRQASDARFLAFMQHSPTLVFIKDESRGVVYVNNASGEVADFVAQMDAGSASVFETGDPSRTIEEVTTAGGEVRQLLCVRFLFSDAEGGRLLGGVCVDVTEQQATEKALSGALAAKDVLLSEVHHRVKNNLQTISSLLNMQADLLPDAAARQALRDAQRRIHSMALIHEQMNGGRELDGVDLGEYARRLARELFDSFGAVGERIRLRMALDPVPLAMDQMIPCGLILNELISNSLKYAFPGERAGEILVSLRCPEGRTVTMTVADNGVGLPPAAAWNGSKSLGLRIVDILTGQLGGILDRQSAGGLTSTVTFPRFA